MRQFVFNTELVRGATFSRGIRYSTLLCQSASAATIALGSTVFAVRSGLAIIVGQRVRASLIGDSTQFVEGPVTAYAGSSLTINVDTIAGATAVYSAWQLSAAVDLTGATFYSTMRLSPVTCASRIRTPSLTINVTGDPTEGTFTIYLTPTQTSALILGDYQYKVMFSPAASSDKFLIVGGIITVVDE